MYVCDMPVPELNVVAALRFTHPPGWSFSPVYRPQQADAVLWVVHHGALRCLRSGQTYILEPGEAVFSHFEDDEFNEVVSGETMVKTVVRVRWLDSSRRFSQLLWSRHSGDNFLEHGVDRCVRSWELGEAQRCSRLVRGLLDEMQEQQAHQGVEDKLVEEVLVKLRDVGVAPDLSAIAESYGVGLRTLQRRFRSVTGRSVREHLAMMRIARAQELLRMSMLGLEQIAEQLGFHDAFHFSRCFKRYCGVSPSVWRRQHT